MSYKIKERLTPLYGTELAKEYEKALARANRVRQMIAQNLRELQELMTEEEWEQYKKEHPESFPTGVIEFKPKKQTEEE